MKVDHTLKHVVKVDHTLKHVVTLSDSWSGVFQIPWYCSSLSRRQIIPGPETHRDVAMQTVGDQTLKYIVRYIVTTIP